MIIGLLLFYILLTVICESDCAEIDRKYDRELREYDMRNEEKERERRHKELLEKLDNHNSANNYDLDEDDDDYDEDFDSDYVNVDPQEVDCYGDDEDDEYEYVVVRRKKSSTAVKPKSKRVRTVVKDKNGNTFAKEEVIKYKKR